MDTAKLREHIQSHLASLPNTDPIQLTTLISRPKRTNEIYPHTPFAPKCWQIEYLVVVGVQVPVSEPVDAKGKEKEKEKENEKQGEVVDKDNSTADDIGGSSAVVNGSVASTAPDLAETDGTNHPTQPRPKPRTSLLTSALSAYLYILPSRAESILYISKLDSSSYGPILPLRLTRTLASSFISFFLLPDSKPTPTLRVQLFARSQGQYLFPNSAGGESKRGISGGRLCGWWKGVYEDAVRNAIKGDSASPNTRTRTGDAGKTEEGKTATPRSSVHARDIRMSYILPSYSAHEAMCLMGLPKRPLPDGVKWEYEPPFPPQTSTDGSLLDPNVADHIPSLPDDPKTRFLDELSIDKGDPEDDEKDIVDGAKQRGKAGVESGAGEFGKHTSKGSHTSPTETPDMVNSTHASGSGPKAPHNAHAKSGGQSEKAKAALADENGRRADRAALSRVSYAEFWERLGFRQECAMDVTGFFSLVVRQPEAAPGKGGVDNSSSTSESRTDGLGPSTAVDSGTVGSTDVEITDGTGPIMTTGPDNDPNPTSVTPPTSSTHPTTTASSSTRHPDPVPTRHQLPPPIVERLHAALLNTDFLTRQLAEQGSQFWMESMRRIVRDEISVEGLQACEGVVLGKDASMVGPATGHGAGAGGKENGQAAGVAGGSGGAGAKREPEVVTMLQPRKKKRPA